MAAADQIDELRHRFAAQPRRYFASLANALRREGAYEEAVTMLRAQLAEAPEHLTGHVVLGQALFDIGALADARQAFETARSLDPGNRVVLRQLGEIASLGGDRATARMWFGRLRAADPYADDVEAQLGGGAPEPPGDDAATADDGAHVAPEREIAEPVEAAVATDTFELLEFDPVPTAEPMLDPVVGLDLAPQLASATSEDAHDAAADVLAAAPHESSGDAPSLDQIASGPFATETMAGLLAAQGHTDQAVALYERLTAERPGDASLRARLDALRGTTAVEPAPDPTPEPPLAPADDDAARGAMLAAAFASTPVQDVAITARAADHVGDTDPHADPYADLSFDRFFVGEATAAEHAPAPSAAPPDDADLARFDAWLREAAA